MTPGIRLDRSLARYASGIDEVIDAARSVSALDLDRPERYLTVLGGAWPRGRPGRWRGCDSLLAAVTRAALA
jgi:hypothetical protein